MRTILPLFSVFWSLSAAAQLFDTQAPLQLTLSFDYEYVIKDRSEKPALYPALLSYTDDSGQSQIIKVKIRTRGKSRKLRATCDFPPLLLQFQPENTAGTPFEDQRNLKLVTHCRRGKRFTEMNQKEFTAYRIYNILTEESYRVRRAKIVYQDFRGKDRIERAGFFIEENRQVRQRLGLKKSSSEEPLMEAPDSENYARVALFNYAIANTDYDFEETHNVQRFLHTEKNRPVFIPYDFDLSGLVDAPYAVAPTVYQIESVRERAVPPVCISEAAMEKVAAQFVVHRSAIQKLLDKNLRLRKKEARRIDSFFNDFWKQLDDLDALLPHFQTGCHAD